MKKNLRIVSAAAAALLAVAPVAATAVSTVSADAVETVNKLGNVTLSNGSTVNVKPNISLNTKAGSVNAAISVSFSATVDGTTATSNFAPESGSSVQLYKGSQEITDLNQVTSDDAGSTYRVVMNNVGLNFGTKNANKEITLDFGKGNSVALNANDTMTQSIKVTTDKNGVVNLAKVAMNVTAKNFANPTVVTWLNATTSAPVTAGNITLYAGSDAGKMNVAQVVAEAEKNYTAMGAKVADPTSNIKDALKAAGVEVDAQGWFVAPKSFTFNMIATSNVNDATATLPVTVTVPNGKEAANVESTSKTIMHASYYYNKEGKRVGTDKIGAYNTVNVLPTTVKLADGKTYYQVVENGKAVDKYINAGNIDGTKRTLKHNAYVYKNNGKAKTQKSGKKTKKVLVKKGTEVTTYGAKFNINGKAYYRIGRNNEYVKVANF